MLSRRGEIGSFFDPDQRRARRRGFKLNPWTHFLEIPPKVFVVDDDEAVRDLIKLLLEVYGFEVEDYELTDAFARHYRRPCRGVVILDQHLPVTTGVDFLNSPAGSRLGLPVILMTGLGDPGLEKDAPVPPGTADFLQKPVSGRLLLATIARVTAEQAWPGGGEDLPPAGSDLAHAPVRCGGWRENCGDRLERGDDIDHLAGPDRVGRGSGDRVGERLQICPHRVDFGKREALRLFSAPAQHSARCGRAPRRSRRARRHGCARTAASSALPPACR